MADDALALKHSRLVVISSGAGFSLRILVFARLKPRRLKPAPLKIQYFSVSYLFLEIARLRK
jgi:hypothetical protein